MKNESAGQTLRTIAFKIGEQDKDAFRVMCLGLRRSQQTVMAAIVRMLTDEYGRDPAFVQRMIASEVD